MKKQKKKVLLLGWDAADWLIINRLIDNGEMPALKGIIEKGVMGNISTLEPAYSPMLWTTIATGKHADKHGILGFSEPTPDHSSIRPVSTSSRKVKAIWNILTQKGYKTHVINWWPSYPAEPVNGIYVSNFFPKKTSNDFNNWPLPVDTVHPPELQNLFSHFRVHPLEFTLEHLHPFIPKIDPKTYTINKKLESIANMLAEASSVQAAATLAMEEEEWDFAAIYWDTIDHFCHGFMNYLPPQMKGISDEDFLNYQQVVDGAYKLMDLMLANLLQLIDENCTVIILSDHGFKSGGQRTLHTPNEPAGPAHHHRNVGIFCAMGPDIHKDEIVYGASLLDITPTILSIFGIPIGEDMDGKPLVEIFKNPPAIETVPSWEDIEGESGMLPDEKRDIDKDFSAEAIKQLIDLGYIEDPGEDILEAVDKTIDELNYNLAQTYLGTNRFNLAKEILEKLLEKYPYRGRYLFKIIRCLMNEAEYDKIQVLLDQFKPNATLKVLDKNKIELIKKRKVPSILNSKEKQNWTRENKIMPVKESLQAKNDLFQTKIIEADLLLQKGKAKKALKRYREIEKMSYKSDTTDVLLGNAYLKLKQWSEAENIFLKVIEKNPDHPNAHLALGICSYNNKDYTIALDHLLNAASIDFYNQLTHYNIGRTLSKLENYSEAAKAYETSLKISPNFGKARNELIELYETKLDNPQKASLFKIKQENHSDELPISKGNSLIIKPKNKLFDTSPIIIVSGLPRSGTSMMMQMLEAGGVKAFTDNVRNSDSNNPKGYYEHEKVKQLLKNNLWMEEAIGKSIKIVVPLLYKIPAAFNYKVIFMKRDMNEIIESQHKMLVVNGKIKEGNYALGIENSFNKYLDRLNEWQSKHKNVELIEINYESTIQNPNKTAKEISDFLNLNLNTEKMAIAVNPQLKRTIIK